MGFAESTAPCAETPPSSATGLLRGLFQEYRGIRDKASPSAVFFLNNPAPARSCDALPSNLERSCPHCPTGKTRFFETQFQTLLGRAASKISLLARAGDSSACYRGRTKNRRFEGVRAQLETRHAFTAPIRDVLPPVRQARCADAWRRF